MLIIDKEACCTIVRSRGIFIYRYKIFMEYVKMGEEKVTTACLYFLPLEGIILMHQ